MRSKNAYLDDKFFMAPPLEIFGRNPKNRCKPGFGADPALKPLGCASPWRFIEMEGCFGSVFRMVGRGAPQLLFAKKHPEGADLANFGGDVQLAPGRRTEENPNPSSFSSVLGYFPSIAHTKWVP